MKSELLSASWNPVQMKWIIRVDQEKRRLIENKYYHFSSSPVRDYQRSGWILFKCYFAVSQVLIKARELWRGSNRRKRELYREWDSRIFRESDKGVNGNLLGFQHSESTSIFQGVSSENSTYVHSELKLKLLRFFYRLHWLLPTIIFHN